VLHVRHVRLEDGIDHEQRENAERQVDIENPAPRQVLDEKTAEQRADHRCQTEHAAEHALIAATQIIAGIEPRYAAVAPAATALVATSVVVTSLLTPILTSMWSRRWGILSPKYRASAAAESFDSLPAASGIEATLDHQLK
jgi:hypothetical protein